MKMLFERLTKTPPSNWKSAVQQNLTVLASCEVSTDSDLPAGVLNFGIPHVSDLGSGARTLERFIAAFKNRIAELEPRIRVLDAEVVEGRVVLRCVSQLEEGEFYLQTEVK